MTSSLTRLIEQEDPRQPYTDEQLAQMLGIRREQVVELRRTAGVADSRTRLRPILTRELARLLAQEPDLSDRSLTARLNESGFKVSRYLVRELRETLPPAPGPVTAAAEPPAPQEAEENLFARMIGFDGGLKAQIHQAKAAVSYPPNGLHTLIIGPSGSGKTLLAETMYRYAIQQKLLAPDAPFVAFNCADYADNPQLLNSQLFGYVRGAFSGATTTRSGLVDKADGGILFLDEIHRLSGEGQEMLFYLLDKGAFRRLGDSGPAHQVKVRLIAATTSSPESALLLTFRRRIPIVISMPALADRPLSERFAVVQSILETEYRKIGRRLVVEREAARLLLQYDCPGNIGQLQSDIQVCCANAFLESVSRQEDAVYIRAELVQQLLPAVTGSRTLEIESQYDRQLVFPPGDAKPQAEAEPDELYKRLKEAVDSDDSSPERIRGLLNQFIHPGPRVLQEAAEAAEVRRRKHQETLALVRTVLADMQDCLLCLGGDFEESVALCLTSQGPHGDPTDTAHLADKYPAEYELARRFASKYCALRPSNLSAYQIQMLTLCLYAFSARRTGKRIRIILMAHGQVGPAMAEVVNHILQDDNAIGFSMDWQESSEQVLERAIRLVQQVDEGLGCLLLVDMGSLASFAPEISLRTGVHVRCVARVDTLMALDAVHRASFRERCTLDELADTLEIGRLHAGFSDLEQRTGKPSAILTVCITGEGYARRIESFLKATVVECRDIKIVDVGLLNRDAMLARVEELRHDYDIVAAVGTINPELPGIPFLPMNYIFSGQGTMALTNLLESHCQRPNGLGDLLDPQLILCDADFNDKNDALDTLCTMLTEKGCVKPDFLLSVYKRENLGATCLPQQIAIPHGDPALVTKPAICIAKTCRPVDWSGGFVAEIVFLFALDESCQIFVQRFCDLLKDENRVKALLSAKSAQEIYDLLR
ncbi:sigma 54-interacting transcriptional regulator [uncultured Subdoligranulum sp.]|uniref:sigma 54-interacting transcriptional regulator n=1 Tax=uncultured Subdoligranulum sp. TaxID=512298 RepID=UPI002621BEA8|nr:sigma 54-interacting transcriptional regulator [uncultured Subdoligranulum sp.]